MPDYGHDIQFGYFLIPDASDPQGVLETALLTDRLGYDLLAVQDHPYQRRHLDTLSLLAVILGQTERIDVMQDVGNVPLRPPAVFAKAAASLDLLSGGRFKAGLGAGGFLEPAEAMGAPALIRARAWRRWRRPSRSCERAGTRSARSASTGATTG
jgi:alkanesulfonate monooxygenase SsuD/methylene tetrahydromethanopterin reductase-like flavin-dependent oxidoreductase (luciferase family)